MFVTDRSGDLISVNLAALVATGLSLMGMVDCAELRASIGWREPAHESRDLIEHPPRMPSARVRFAHSDGYYPALPRRCEQVHANKGFVRQRWKDRLIRVRMRFGMDDVNLGWITAEDQIRHAEVHEDHLSTKSQGPEATDENLSVGFMSGIRHLFKVVALSDRRSEEVVTRSAHSLDHLPTVLIRSFIERLSRMVDSVCDVGYHTDVYLTCLCEGEQ